MLILGIETSCDETAAAVVRDGCEVKSNIIASQILLHSSYGGVVPELASRAHIQRIMPVADEALKHAGVASGDIDAIAVTLGPGLIGSLLVGVEYAKALSYSWHKPLIAVHHIAGHLFTPFLEIGSAASKTEHLKANDTASGTNLKSADFKSGEKEKLASSHKKTLRHPYIGLVISGGHSSIILVREPGVYEVIGETIDDAAGEAYDKVAKLLNLGYPGGPVIDKLAAKGNPNSIKFPRPLFKSNDLNFSFSGLKTAVMKYIKDEGLDKIKESEIRLCDVAASFQEAVIDSLLNKTGRALDEHKISQLAIVGGVACNKGLRASAMRMFGEDNTFIPPPILCTDNAAMIAGLSYFLKDKIQAGRMDLDACADLALDYINLGIFSK